VNPQKFQIFSDYIVQEYDRTGYVWEQYDAVSGEGKRRWVFYDVAVGLRLIRIRTAIHSLVGLLSPHSVRLPAFSHDAMSDSHHDALYGLVLTERY